MNLDEIGVSHEDFQENVLYGACCRERIHAGIMEEIRSNSEIPKNIETFVSKAVIDTIKKRIRGAKIARFYEHGEECHKYDLKWLIYGSRPVGHKFLNTALVNFIKANRDVPTNMVVNILSMNVHDKKMALEDMGVNLDILPC